MHEAGSCGIDGLRLYERPRMVHARALSFSLANSDAGMYPHTALLTSVNRATDKPILVRLRLHGTSFRRVIRV